MQADLRVLSLDLAQRRYLCAIRSQVHGLSGLYWVSPVEDGVLDWLAKGAVDTPSLTLQGVCP
ncbi:MAG: hypothetical protein JNM72_24100 [Deltaproteobacteria bacterium]|nr:hypothetical protein [Deltaproteobacteria bacterium]